jgi:hypothetical protein
MDNEFCDIQDSLVEYSLYIITLIGGGTHRAELQFMSMQQRKMLFTLKAGGGRMKTLGLHFAFFFGISLALAAGGGTSSNDLYLDKASAAFKIAVNSGTLMETGFDTFGKPAFVLDHFNVRLGHPNRKIVNTPFQVTITAKDSSGRTVTDYSGENTLNLNSDSHATIAPAAVTLTNGVWQGVVTISAAEYGVVILTSGADKKGKSAAFDVFYPGPYSIVRGQVRYNGNPFLNSAHVDFSLHDETAGRRYPVPPSCYNPVNGRFSIPNVRRGTYAIFLKTDSDTPPSFNPFPGDFWGGSSSFMVAAPNPTIRNFAVCRLIHLTSPVNNDPPGIPVSPPYPSHPTPVTFAWDPIPEAATYEIEIVKAQDDSNQDIGVVLRESGLTATSKAASLPANEPGQHYAFRVVAVNQANECVGDFYVTMTNPGGGIYGFRGDYLFKIL